MDSANSNFYCPITSQLMVDPVIDREGNTYDRTAIVEWLERHGTSPITRRPLLIEELTPNRSLRSAIEDYKATIRQKKYADSKTSESKNVEAKAGESKDGSNLDEDNAAESKDGERRIYEAKHTVVEESTAPPPDVTCSYATKFMSRDEANNTDTYQCLIRLDTTDIDRPPVPSDIVVVIDISGSMGNEAKTRSVESSGLSLLDVVKHGVKTIIRTLGPQDRLAVVSFSNRASVVFNLIIMDEAGKAEAIERLDELLPEGMTNLWDGLSTALDLLKTRTSLAKSLASSTTHSRGVGGRNASILLLTDGEPNIEPPRGHLPMLRKYRDTNGGLYPGSINTFGFGYALDSKLLVDIAREAGGMYAFIPDSGFVGTAFVNSLANILATVGVEANVTIEAEGSVKYVIFRLFSVWQY
jgi:Mg-chelatase subunit ChlD